MSRNVIKIKFYIIFVHGDELQNNARSSGLLTSLPIYIIMINILIYRTVYFKQYFRTIFLKSFKCGTVMY